MQREILGEMLVAISIRVMVIHGTLHTLLLLVDVGLSSSRAFDGIVFVDNLSAESGMLGRL